MEKIYTRVMVAMLALIMAVSFSACSDDDDEPAAPTTGNIVGTWESVEKNNVGQTNESTTTITLVFHSNGTGSRQTVEKYVTGAQSSDMYTFKYTVAVATNGVLTVTVIDDDDNYTQQWTVTQTGNTLMVGSRLYTRK